jgi:hypothetical protein
MIVFLLPPSLWTYSLMTIISIETRKHLAESTAPAHSFKQRVENQNHHLHYLQAQALTQQQQQKTLWLAPTRGRTKYLVLAQLRVSNNDSQPPTWPCPTTHYPDLDQFSHVVEHVLLLQQDNVICQALLDS